MKVKAWRRSTFISAMLILVIQLINLRGRRGSARSPGPLRGGNASAGTAIVIVADQRVLASYRPALRSMRCYGQRHGYDVHVLDPRDHSFAGGKCSSHGHMMFRRHCMALHVMESGGYGWVAGFDGDVGALDAGRRLESLLTRPGLDVVHEERFHNGEVQAGAYLVRNSEFGRKYLRDWMKYETALPTGFDNADNGALHLHLLRQVTGIDKAKVRECEAAWDRAYDVASYDLYVACCMQAIARPGGPSNIRLVRRGHGFVRDLGVTGGNVSTADFFLHALKDDVKFYDEEQEASDGCGTAAWEPRLRQGTVLSVEEMKGSIQRADARAKADRPVSVLDRALVGWCWPECPEYW